MKFVGIDVHKKTIILRVVDQSRKHLDQKRFQCADESGIVAPLERHLPIAEETLASQESHCGHRPASALPDGGDPENGRALLGHTRHRTVGGRPIEQVVRGGPPQPRAQAQQTGAVPPALAAVGSAPDLVKADATAPFQNETGRRITDRADAIQSTDPRVNKLQENNRTSPFRTVTSERPRGVPGARSVKPSTHDRVNGAFLACR